MSKSIKGTQTEKNLLVAFAGESQVRNLYTYFAGAAKKEGLVQQGKCTRTAKSVAGHTCIPLRFILHKTNAAFAAGDLRR